LADSGRSLINYQNLDMTDANAISWKKVSVEATAIVASILLAFAIDAWWADVQERKFEAEVLVALLAEFQDHREELASSRLAYVDMTNAVNGLISYTRTGEHSSDQYSIDEQVSLLTIPWTTDFGSGVRDALISAGQIGTISDKALRYEIAEWSSVLDELKDDEQHGVSLVFDLVIPYMTREGVPYAEIEYSKQDAPISNRSRSLEDDAETSNRVFKDPEFLSILEVRRNFLGHTIVEIDNLIAATDSIIVKIEASLGDQVAH